MECPNCQANTFQINKKAKAKDEQTLIVGQTMMHDGFGWDVNQFQFECNHCGYVEPIVKIEELKP